MDTVILVKPSLEYEKGFLDMAGDWCANERGHIPWYFAPDCELPAWVEKLMGFERGVGLAEGYVENTTFWLVNAEKRVLGATNIRHRLNEFYLNYGGHIGYGIRPSERGRGYGKEILRLGLIEAKKLGHEKVLVSCNKDNIASARIIVANGGVLEDERVKEGRVMQRYWIEIQLLGEIGYSKFN